MRNDRIEEMLVRTLEQVGIDAKGTCIGVVGETEFQLPNGEFCLPTPAQNAAHLEPTNEK